MGNGTTSQNVDKASGSYTANQTKGHWSHGPWIESTAVTEIHSRAQRSTKRKACRCTQRNQRVQPGSNVLSFSSTLKCQQEFCEPSSPLWILWIRERKRGMWDKTHFSNLKPEKTWKNMKKQSVWQWRCASFEISGSAGGQSLCQGGDWQTSCWNRATCETKIVPCFTAVHAILLLVVKHSSWLYFSLKKQSTKMQSLEFRAKYFRSCCIPTFFRDDSRLPDLRNCERLKTTCSCCEARILRLRPAWISAPDSDHGDAISRDIWGLQGLKCSESRVHLRPRRFRASCWGLPRTCNMLHEDWRYNALQ